MGDKQQGQTQLFGKLTQQIDHLCLYRDIQGRDGFVTDDKFRL